MSGYRIIRAGGGDSGNAIVRWGPEFGGDGGDLYDAQFDASLTAIALAGVLPMEVATQLTALMVDYEAATLLLSTDNPSNTFTFIPTELELSNFLSDLRFGGFETALDISTNINSVAYSTTTPGSFSLIAPTGSTSAIVELGAGGGAGGWGSVNGGGGGGGGERIRDNGYPITGGNSYPLVVGAGGIWAVGAGNSTAGENSTFDGTGVVAIGGGVGGDGAALGGQGDGGAGGTGGTGDVSVSGGTGGGGSALQTNGGGGGGGAGDTTAGGDGGPGGGAGSIGPGGTVGGGDGAAGAVLLAAAGVAQVPSGGGGGRSTAQDGSDGAGGMARVTFLL